MIEISKSPNRAKHLLESEGNNEPRELVLSMNCKHPVHVDPNKIIFIFFMQNHGRTH